MPQSAAMRRDEDASALARVCFGKGPLGQVQAASAVAALGYRSPLSPEAEHTGEGVVLECCTFGAYSARQ